MSRFAQDTQVVACGPGQFQGAVSADWSVNGNPNGGYLMALLAKATLQCADKTSSPIVTANFLSRAVPGPVDIRVEEIARSTQFQRFEARLLQGDKERVRALLTFADDGEESAARYETGPTALAARTESVKLPQLPGYTLFDSVELLLDPASAGWMQGQLSDRSENKGWMRLRDGTPFDLPSLLLIADAMPPAILASRGMVAWVPTVELSVNVRQLPKSRWLNCALRTRFVTGACLEADGEIWDEDGSLIAISRQIARLRTPASSAAGARAV